MDKRIIQGESGKAVVTNIIKLIPGAGTVVGGAISAGTAGVITAALGEAYIKIMEPVFNGEMKIEDLSSKEGKDKMAKFFKENLKRNAEYIWLFTFLWYTANDNNIRQIFDP